MGAPLHRRARIGGPPRLSRGRHAQMSEINVTPFVDVMLVLLIIFMVTAPLLTVGVQVNLPKTESRAIPGSDEPLTISINAKGQIYLQETKIDLQGLIPRLRVITGENPDVRIFIRGDKAIDYGSVMRIMGAINGAGYNRVALVTTSTKAPASKASDDSSVKTSEGGN